MFRRVFQPICIFWSSISEEKRTMSKTPRIYNSSIGQKLFVALAGLFLCLFLVIHLSGNLLLFKNDGGKAFDRYAEFMSRNAAVRSMELVLFAGFLVHIIFALRVWLHGRRARPNSYAVNRPSGNSTLASRTMIVTGSTIFIFLVIHLRTFFVPARFSGQAKPSMYSLVKAAFANPVYVAFYLVALAFLGYHLRHGFQSAFQTFGLRPGRQRLIDLVAIVFWFLIPIGFATMPVYFFWTR